MITYEIYDSEMHRLFALAFGIRCNSESTDSELIEAQDSLKTALDLSNEMEKEATDVSIVDEIAIDRLRCYIELIAIATRQLKNAYGKPSFKELSVKHEQYCKQYMDAYTSSKNEAIQQSQYQLMVMAYQSLAANYFRRSGMGKDRSQCDIAVAYLDKALELTQGDKMYNVLLANKRQIEQAIISSSII